MKGDDPKRWSPRTSHSELSNLFRAPDFATTNVVKVDADDG